MRKSLVFTQNALVYSDCEDKRANCYHKVLSDTLK